MLCYPPCWLLNLWKERRPVQHNLTLRGKAVKACEERAENFRLALIHGLLDLDFALIWLKSLWKLSVTSHCIVCYIFLLLTCMQCSLPCVTVKSHVFIWNSGPRHLHFWPWCDMYAVALPLCCLWMTCLCLHLQKKRRRKIDRSMIGEPTNFVHLTHIGSGEMADGMQPVRMRWPVKV